MTPRHRCSVRPMARDSGCRAAVTRQTAPASRPQPAGVSSVEPSSTTTTSRLACSTSRSARAERLRFSPVGLSWTGSTTLIDVVASERRTSGPPMYSLSVGSTVRPIRPRNASRMARAFRRKCRDGEPRRPRQVVQRLAEVDERQPSGDEQTPPAHDEDEVAQAVIPTPARLVEPAAGASFGVAPTGVLRSRRHRSPWA